MLQFPIAMTPRTEPARALSWISPLIALALTVLTGFCLFAALGQDPIRALGIFFIAPLDSLRGWTEVGVKMTPLLLCAVRPPQTAPPKAEASITTMTYHFPNEGSQRSAAMPPVMAPAIS